MKIKHALAALIATFALAACSVPAEDGTAADRAEVNQENKKGDGGGGKAKKEEGPKETAGQENARESAAGYLDTAAFSRSGLIDQLKFEGYSVKDATYGVDAQKADWNKQAAASAQSYLDTSSFSRTGLIDQLKFEGFTQAQAEFGVKKAGL